MEAVEAGRQHFQIITTAVVLQADYAGGVSQVLVRFVNNGHDLVINVLLDRPFTEVDVLTTHVLYVQVDEDHQYGKRQHVGANCENHCVRVRK